jgi:hypothetical protein
MSEEEREPIRGKVARILTTRQLVMTVGRADGVAIGMKFDVLDPRGEDITDPDTEAVLGSIHRPKVRVEVVQVQERISVAQTYRKWRVNVGGSGVALGLGLAEHMRDAFAPPRWVEKYETLKTQEKTWEDLDESQSYVKRGDPVIEITGTSAIAVDEAGND